MQSLVKERQPPQSLRVTSLALRGEATLACSYFLHRNCSTPVGVGGGGGGGGGFQSLE